MTATIRLQVVEFEEGDTGYTFTEGKGFVGEDDENLACGACGFLLGRGVSTRSMYKMFAAPKRLTVTCGCGARNAVPSQIFPEQEAK